MKRIIIVLFVLFSSTLYSQGIIDAVELTNYKDIFGSARFQAMGGAFTALGGDLSATGLNPASSSVFHRSEAVFSYDYSTNKNEAAFYNNGGSASKNYGNLNNLGVVFVLNNTSGSNINLAFSINYDRIMNFNENIQFEGNNDTYLEVSGNNNLYYEGYSSLATSFVLASNYYTPDNLPLAEGLAFDTYLTDINVPESAYYDSRYPDYSDQNPVYVTPVVANNSLQKYSSNRSGTGGVYNFTASIDFNNKLYIGLGYKSMLIDRSETIRISESDFDQSSDMESFSYTSYVDTYGRSSSFSVGAIYNTQAGLRIGASYQFPNTSEMQDFFSYEIESNFKTPDSDGYYSYSGETQEAESSYDIKGPAKFNAGIAYIIGKAGLISVDYNYIDYSTVRFKPDYLFNYENQDLAAMLKSVHNFSVGGEFNVSFVSLRAGYKYQQSPYKDMFLESDTHTYSGGIGINFRTWNFDIAYSQMQSSSDLYIYETDLVDAANIFKRNSNLTFSLRLKI